MIAIERDARCLPALAEIAAHFPGRLEVVEADAIGFDPRPLLGGAPARIVANLPYNVGTVLLANWLTEEAWPPWWQSLTLMFQREVAERIVADESDRKNYGRLGVLCGWRTEARVLFDVPPPAFVPPPKITSSVVRLTPRKAAPALPRRRPRGRHEGGLRRGEDAAPEPEIARPEPASIIAAAGTGGTGRAEQVPVAGFVALANTLHRLRPDGARPSPPRRKG